MSDLDQTFTAQGTLQKILIFLATGCGLGRLKPAPGTWGTLGAALAAVPWLLMHSQHVHVGFAIAALFASVVGLATCNAAIAAFGCSDPSQVVIDEIAGLWLALAVIPQAQLLDCPWLSVGLAFLLFRLFDIAKPWPVSYFERMPRAWGIMIDDLAAGALAGMLATAAVH